MNPLARHGMRISIIGTSGSGKSTLALKLCAILACKHIEIDAYAWKPGWKKKPDEELLEEVEQEVKHPFWVACGNWDITRDLIWNEATHLVWLKLPFYQVFWRLLKRTVFNILTKKEIAGGNVETFRQQFLSKHSIFLWALQIHWKQDELYNNLINSATYAPLEIVILRSQKQIEAWIEQVTAAYSSTLGSI